MQTLPEVWQIHFPYGPLWSLNPPCNTVYRRLYFSTGEPGFQKPSTAICNSLVFSNVFNRLKKKLLNMQGTVSIFFAQFAGKKNKFGKPARQTQTHRAILGAKILKTYWDCVGLDAPQNRPKMLKPKIGLLFSPTALKFICWHWQMRFRSGKPSFSG